MMFWKTAKEIVAATAEKARGFFASGGDEKRKTRTPVSEQASALLRHYESQAPSPTLGAGFAADSCDNSIKAAYALGQPHMSEAVLGFFLSQGFIGHQIAAMIATHWLIAKVCRIPARDAIRQGYLIVSDDGEELDSKVLRAMRKADERFKINAVMLEYIHLGRVFGIRIAYPIIDLGSPEANKTFYENPFNPDAIKEGSYKGMNQVDPTWTSPLLDQRAAGDPSSPDFYEPTWWLINGVKYHRSHLIIFRNGEVPDILKPAYLYGGVPVPQQIMERVYNAERTANEAPQLAMTKRTTVFATDVSAAFADKAVFDERMVDFVHYRDNYAMKIMDKEADEMQQFDTSLADLDSVIMTGYQLVAAAGGVPATKLLETTPKGFNATGEYEEASYHEGLESIQTHDLTPLMERHHLCLMRSEIAPKMLGGVPISTSVNWEALDSPTAKEYAEIGNVEADRDSKLAALGAIDEIDVRNRLRADRNSGYHGIEEAIPEDPQGATAVLNEPGAVGDAADGVRLVSNQRYLDPGIVSQKISAADYEVQVSPVFVARDGSRYRVIIDGHHSLEAARQARVTPTFVEGDYAGSDYQAIAEYGS